MSEPAATHLPHIRFSSRDTTPASALDYWRDSLSRSWEMAIDPRHADAFEADVSMWKMDDVILGTGTFGPVQTRMRRERNIRGDQLDHYRLILLRDGEFHCDADGRQVSLAPRRFVITDMAQPESNASCCSTTILYIPRALLDQALPRPMALHGAAPVNACAGLLADHLAAMVAGVDGIVPAALPGLTRATVSLVAASLATSADNTEAARPAIESVLLRRARRFVEDNLARDDLDAAAICAHLRISRSTLYRLFDGIGGVAGFVRERRLARVHALLGSGRERPNIARLAEAHGFRSATHFSRAFRAQFGYSPREVPTLAEAASGTADAARAARFDRWLGTLYG